LQVPGLIPDTLPSLKLVWKTAVAAITYISLPLRIFFAGFLRWYYAFLGIAALLFMLYRTVLLEDTRVGSFDNGSVTLNFSAENPGKTFFFRHFAK